MPTNIKNYVTKEFQSKVAVAAPTGTFQVGEMVGNNAVQGSATALGRLKKVIGSGATTVLLIDSIQGTTLIADAATLTGYTSAATAVVDTVANVGAETVNGQDVYMDATGFVKKQVTGSRVRKEVLFASRNFATKQAA